ncbi:DUF986 domain-containing protein [Muribacter muris]|uniref:UPF0266 membrane protein E4T80_01420 n=1 Tax=Muribacter muris TaxID=67855 RepID=A0A4Y9K7U9_9PAST|nr:DUF986 family protein [Muribacter muris]MBF0784138.1 DUF986 domain-containing protein [Muribacter muris]MBF0827633.1 DUF986 domain-containing protein [Muribacter muris]TFV13190.1 DUF986 domain-containing protein [Muribacter muris]
MTNAILLLGILAGFAYALYDQILMDRLKGENRLSVELQRQAGIDVWISVGLIILTVINSLQTGIEPLTLFLLAICILLCLYLAFFRSPRLILKQQGFFFANVYFDYAKIRQINLADKQILVIDLHNGRRLLVRIKQQSDVERVVNFFGGYQ